VVIFPEADADAGDVETVLDVEEAVVALTEREVVVVLAEGEVVVVLVFEDVDDTVTTLDFNVVRVVAVVLAVVVLDVRADVFAEVVVTGSHPLWHPFDTKQWAGVCPHHLQTIVSRYLMVFMNGVKPYPY
jgi:hypothetical protein